MNVFIREVSLFTRTGSTRTINRSFARCCSGVFHRVALIGGRGEGLLDDMLCRTGILRVRIARRCAGISDILLGANRTSVQAQVA
jgi:hypothetical protein